MLSSEDKLTILEKLSNNFELKTILTLLKNELLDFSAASGLIIYILDKERPSTLIAKEIHTPAPLAEFAEIYLNSEIDLSYNPLFSDCLEKNAIIEIPVHKEMDSESEQNAHKISSLWGIHHGLILPLKRSDQQQSACIGLVLLYHSQTKFHPELTNQLRELIDLFYYDLINALTIDEVFQNKNAILSAKEKFKNILDFISNINMLSDMDTLYKKLILQFAKIYGFELGFLQLAQNQKLFPAAGASTLPQYQSKVEELILHFRIPENIPRLDNPLSPQTAACASFFHKTHFFFPDTQHLRSLPMLELDRKAIQVAPKPLHSILIFPLIHNNESIGILQLWSVSHPVTLSETDFEILYSLCSFIPTILQNAQNYSQLKLAKEMLEQSNHQLLQKNEEIESKQLQTKQELKLAHNVQFQLLPARYPDIPGLRFTHLYQPMEEVGGDIYDFVKFKENHLVGIFVSDVSGHGMPAALITSMIKTLLETSGRRRLDPIELLSYINEKIVHQIEGNYLTAFYGVYDTRNQKFLYARAAHPFPLLIRQEKIIPLKGKGTVLGMMREVDFYHYEIFLEPGDKLLIFTDGLSEAQNDEEILFGTLLNDVILKNSQEDIDTLIRNIYYELCEFTQKNYFEDDICIVGMEVTPEALSSES